MDSRTGHWSGGSAHHQLQFRRAEIWPRPRRRQEGTDGHDRFFLPVLLLLPGAAAAAHGRIRRRAGLVFPVRRTVSAHIHVLRLSERPGGEGLACR